MKFKTETLVACGFLVGAHPGFLCRNEAEEEICGSLGLDKGELDFQTSFRSISAPLREGEKERFSFHAVVVETSSKDASRLRERFYELKHPLVAMIDYPCTGNYINLRRCFNRSNGQFKKITIWLVSM
jgi:hypothetical protein